MYAPPHHAVANEPASRRVAQRVRSAATQLCFIELSVRSSLTHADPYTRQYCLQRARIHHTGPRLPPPEITIVNICPSYLTLTLTNPKLYNFNRNPVTLNPNNNSNHNSEPKTLTLTNSSRPLNPIVIQTLIPDPQSEP